MTLQAQPFGLKNKKNRGNGLGGVNILSKCEVPNSSGVDTTTFKQNKKKHTI